MTTDCRTTVLRDLLTTTKDGDWGSGEPKEGHVPYRVIRGADFPAVRIGNTSTVPLRYLPAATVGRRTLQSNDILIETAGGSKDRPTGRTLLIKKRLLEQLDHPATCASFARFMRVDKLRVDPCFLYWYLQSIYATGEMNQHQVQHTGVARFQYTRFAETQRVVLPSRPEQESIAELLGTLDDKIDCNERIRVSANETAAALLSDLLAKTEREGTLTKGRLRDVANVNSRAVKPGSGSFRYLDISSIGVGHAQEPAILDWSQAPGRARRGVADGDVLWSTVRPNRESHWLVLDPPTDLVVSTGFAVLTPTSVGPSFLYGMTERRQFIDYLVCVAEGSAYPAVRADRFLDAPIPLPPLTAVSAYEALTLPLRRRAHAAAQESRVLGRLRDLLLPRLLSGELRMRDVEPLVGEVV